MHPLILRLCCSIADPSGEDDEAAVEHRWISDVNCCRPNASIGDFLQNKFYQALDNGFGDSIDKIIEVIPLNFETSVNV